MKHSMKRNSGRFSIPAYILLAVCIFGQSSEAQKSIYSFDSNQSNVVKTGGFAGVHETYLVNGLFQLTVDVNTGTASFDYVEAFLLSPVSSAEPEHLGELFNMTELAGTVVDDTTIEFRGKTADDTNTDIHIQLTLTDNSVYLSGQTIPPPNSADFFIYNLDALARRKYDGGTGEPNNPFQIATAENLILLGETPEDYDKHFVLTAEIDLDPNLPGRKVFDKAVIAPETNDTELRFQGTPFKGVFNGNGHVISNLHIQGSGYLGLFGCLDYGAKIFALGLDDVDINGTGEFIGGLVGSHSGSITSCYSTGKVSGREDVGGLVCGNYGDIEMCYSTTNVSGNDSVGGLVGFNTQRSGSISLSFNTGTVTGDGNVGGLVGCNYGPVINCYSHSVVNGRIDVGGLAGLNLIGGRIRNCYSTGRVSGVSSTGGLIGRGDGTVVNSIWDIEASGQAGSDGCAGLTTAEMMDPNMLGLNGFADDPNWVLNPGLDYPRLAWESTPGQIIPEPEMDWLEGDGTTEQPYRIINADQLILLGKASILWDKSFVLGADIDLDPNLPDGQVFEQAVIPIYTGVFDGNDHIISNLTITGKKYLGLFGQLGSTAEVKNLGIEDVNITGTDCLGSLAAISKGNINTCHSTGKVTGNNEIGGLVGSNRSNITMCYSTGMVTGIWLVGGLAGVNDRYSYNITEGITASYSTVTVSGDGCIGGFVGGNGGSSGGNIAMCYSTGTVNGDRYVGGFVGFNSYGDGGEITDCYSTGLVTGNEDVGGLVGRNGGLGSITSCLWDVETSGLINMCGDQAERATGCDDSFGKTTAEMQTESTFTDTGWDFVGETANGTEDIWWIDEGQDYPRLWWERDEAEQAGVIELDDTNFDALIADGVVLVDFFATWCSHCTTQAPILEDVAELVQGRARVAKLDVDKAHAISQRYQVNAIPTLILFRDGLEIQRFVGVTSADILVAAILSAVDS